VPAESFKRITEKIVRGIFYVEEQRFIEPQNKIDFFALAGDEAALWERLLGKFGTVYAREPGIGRADIYCPIVSRHTTLVL
jgi:hypothetical protein